MSIKQPIYHEFDLNATSGYSKVISLTHTDDAHVDVIELCVKQQGVPVDITGATVVARMVVHSTADILLNDSVPCTINSAGNILIPFDNAAIQSRKGIVKIEVNITRTPDILTLQLPLWVKINGSILDDATVDPHSEGTIPELLKDAADALEEATQALEDAKDYDNLENKPQINSHTLSGNKSSDDLGLQKKLTAGQNITIESDGTISADGGIDDYNELINLPRVFMKKDDTSGFDAQILGRITFTDLQFEGNISFIPGKPSSQEVFVRLSPAVPTNYMVTEDWWGNYDFNQLKANFAKSGTFKIPLTNVVNKPNEFNNLIGELFITHHFQPQHSSSSASFIRLVTGINSNNDIINYIQISELQSTGYGSRTYNLISASTWQEIGGSNQLISAVVNQNGTITFTNSDGTTFTTTGSSVIGPQGPAGADGHDYVLTAQDKSDIADIVLSELPTTQGVLYGNTSN